MCIDLRVSGLSNLGAKEALLSCGRGTITGVVCVSMVVVKVVSCLSLFGRGASRSEGIWNSLASASRPERVPRPETLTTDIWTSLVFEAVETGFTSERLQRRQSVDRRSTCAIGLE